jgi:hypothetical protein
MDILKPVSLFCRICCVTMNVKHMSTRAFKSFKIVPTKHPHQWQKKAKQSNTTQDFLSENQVSLITLDSLIKLMEELPAKILYYNHHCQSLDSIHVKTAKSRISSCNLLLLSPNHVWIKWTPILYRGPSSSQVNNFKCFHYPFNGCYVPVEISVEFGDNKDTSSWKGREEFSATN